MRRITIALFVSFLSISGLACSKETAPALGPAPEPPTTAGAALPDHPSLAREAVADELAHTCDPPPEVAEKFSTYDMHEAAHHSIDCRRDKLSTLPHGDESALEPFVKAACGLVEDLSWIDFDEGVRYDGTLRGLNYEGCAMGVYDDRVYVLSAISEGAISDLASEIRARAGEGEATRRRLAQLDAAARAVVKPGKATPPGATPMGPAERTALIQEIGAIQIEAAALAKATCDASSTLAATLGGPGPCADAVTLATLAWAKIEKVGGP
jgi:hypothetical protein